MKKSDIDNGKSFDFGKTSADYAQYRDIYPDSLYAKMLDAGIGRNGSKILDLGTGTGVFPRNMCRFGASFHGVDISAEQIREARRLCEEQRLPVTFSTASAEDIDFPDQSFDAVTAVQCFLYFNKEKVLPTICRILRDDGLFATVWMAWLPGESEIARKTEELILKYNPEWQGCGYTRQPSDVPEWSLPYFRIRRIENYVQDIPFEKTAWLGRIRACRGVAASMDSETIEQFQDEHEAMLSDIKAEAFTVPHQILIHVYDKKLTP
ncbi:MAG: class I SAM-dependent methyltransferase [Clostridiales bacterium]|nr:class I SAM-dependent methyltransferase [Clostridiales bacterium]